MSATDHLSDLQFSSLELAPQLLAGLQAMGYDRCTPIQAESLPKALQGKDIAGQAQTGTGKTAAFLLATMHRLLTTEPHPARRAIDPRAVILAPTRELAIQIAKDSEALGSQTDLKICLAYGGTDYDKQRNNIQAGCDILIGTPGRVIDYLKQRVFEFRSVEVCVLDEADRMFDLGFIKDIRFLLRRMPEYDRRLNLLYSATLSQRVLELAYEHMNDPTLVKIEADTVTADRVRQKIYYTANEEKIPLLVGLMHQLQPERSIVFVNTKHMVEKVGRFLNANDVRAEVISGDVRQSKRQRILEEFQAGDLPVLVATDVAARGLHIPAVSHVFNFDLPDDPEDYVHRIGRTARAGAEGDAISFGCETYAFHLGDIEQYIKHAIPSEPVPTDLLANLKRPPPRPRKPSSGNGGGRRPSRGGNRNNNR